MITINFGDGTNIIGSAHNEGIEIVNTGNNENSISYTDIKNELVAIRDYIEKNKNISYVNIEDIDTAIENLNRRNIDKFKENMHKIKDRLVRISEEVGIQVISQYLAGALLK